MKLGSSIRRRRRREGTESLWKRIIPGWIREDRDGRNRWAVLKEPWVLGSLVALSVAGFAAGYIISTRVVYPPPPPPGDLFAVPDLTGLSPEAAADTLSTLGLVLGAVDSMAHPVAPMGQIIGQSPLPGQLSLPGGSVRLALSTGPERRPVPDVLRLNGDRAQVVLETSGFVVTVDSVESDDPRGRVVAMVPEPGAEAVIPAEVHLGVSMGPAEFEMPLVLDLPEAEARAILEAQGLVVGEVETRFRFGRDQGMVVEQEPPASTMVQEGTVVRLVVGRRGEEAGRAIRNNPRPIP